MARRPPPPSIDHPTLEYFAFRGPHRVATGSLAPAGLAGVVFAPTPGRRLTWVIWPSTQTAPSRPTHWEMARAICRTGAGADGEVSRAMPRP